MDVDRAEGARPLRPAQVLVVGAGAVGGFYGSLLARQGMQVAVGYAWSGPAPAGTEPIDLAEATAVCGVHLGEMARIGESWQALARWVTANGYRFDGPCREFYVRSESEDQRDWVTELQQPVAR